MGKRVPLHRQYQSSTPSFWSTFVWVVPCMAALLVAGFLLGRNLVAPRYLDSGTVRINRLEPVRILSPSEAMQAAKDEPSHVWTEGVKPSDIPKLEVEHPRRRARRPTTDTTAAPATGTTTGAQPAPAAPRATPEPTATPAPAPAPAPSDNTDTAVPLD